MKQKYRQRGSIPKQPDPWSRTTPTTPTIFKRVGRGSDVTQQRLQTTWINPKTGEPVVTNNRAARRKVAFSSRKHSS
jgi:hypothetical protein